MKAEPSTRPDQGREGCVELDAIVVGAGFAGLYALYSLRELGFSVEVVEAGHGVGGTWYWNRYPGARCDTESVDYSYSFSPELEQEWEWTERYPAQPEILRYLNHVADRFDLRRSIRFRTRVTQVHLDADTDRWLVRTDTGRHYSAALCVMAAGNLSTPHIPRLPGIESYQGRILHTSRWPEEGVDFTGRSVGVIGTGSTGIQAIPNIARRAGHVYVFQRTPNYSIPAQNRPLTKEELAAVKAEYPERRRRNRLSRSGVDVQRNPKSALEVSSEEREDEYSRRWQVGGNGYFLGAYTDLYSDLDANETAADFVRRKIRDLVQDPDVAERLTPRSYPIGSKRVCVDIDYFHTYNRGNVTLVDIGHSPIREVTSQSVCTGDAECRVDDLVFATGFDAITGPLLAMDIRGRGGLALKEKWAQAPSTYLGLMTAGFPNLFIVTGPGSPSVLSNVVLSIEHHVEFISKMLEDMKVAGHSVVEPSPEAERRWTDHVDEIAHGTLYPRANSWYMGANIPGKPRRFMLYAAGVDVYQKECADIVEAGYEGFTFKR